MENLTVGEFKANFSEVLEKVQKGEKVAVVYGKSRKPVGMFVPYENPAPKKRKLGIWEGKCKVEWVGDGKITVEEFLGIE